MARKQPIGPGHPDVESWDDEREIGNGVIVTLRPGLFFYDDCGVMGFDTMREAKTRTRDAVEAMRAGELG